MGRVTGIGGIFFKVRDTKATAAWYERHLKIPAGDYGWNFSWKDAETGAEGLTVWSPFKAETDYFAPSDASFMVNYRVEDLDGLLAELAAAGIAQVGTLQEESYGRFAWILDPDGNKIELWEPPAGGTGF
jgi:catechol 2,3-dioxygenase-like lactoylglutathione lyase family enzyme